MRARGLSTLFVVVAMLAPAGAHAAPANDAFSKAVTLSVPGSARGTIAGATVQNGEPRPPGCSMDAKTVWYRFRTAQPTPVAIDVAEEGDVATVAVYTGTKLARLRLVHCSFQSTFDRAGFIAEPGQTYHIQIGASSKSYRFDFVVSAGVGVAAQAPLNQLYAYTDGDGVGVGAFLLTAIAHARYRPGEGGRVGGCVLIPGTFLGVCHGEDLP